jgi:adenylate cyclase
MNDLADSTLEHVRSDIAELLRRLSDVSTSLSSRFRSPQVNELCERIAQLNRFLERLDAGLEQQEKDKSQLEGLIQVSRAINSTLDLDEVLNRAMDVIIQVTRAERGFLMLTDPMTGQLVFQVARNMDRDVIARPSFEVSRSIIERVAKTGQPVITTDAQRDPRFAAEDSVISLNLRSILCHPLVVKERIIGIVYVDNRMHIGQFQPEDVKTLRAFADQAAIAIDNAQLFKSVREQMTEISKLKTFQDNIFASVPSGLIATDRSDRITSFNRSAAMILGVPERVALGRPYRDVLAALLSTPLPRLIDSVNCSGAQYAAAEIDVDLPTRGAVNLSFGVSSLRDVNEAPLGVTIVVDDLTEKRRLEATREMFRRYVAPAVVDRLPSDPDKLRLGGARQAITILFADIRNFTELSEQLAPEELVEILNQYLAIAANAVLKYEGTLDKFMGDAVMAIFNAPLPQADHPLLAVRAALEIRQAVARLHDRLPKAQHLEYGVGIHSGDAVVGNVGTRQQMNFTAIGDAVNVARRLQESAAGGQIIFSQAVYRQVREQVKATRLPSLRVKGRRQVEQVWELNAMRD